MAERVVLVERREAGDALLMERELEAVRPAADRAGVLLVLRGTDLERVAFAAGLLAGETSRGFVATDRAFFTLRAFFKLRAMFEPGTEKGIRSATVTLGWDVEQWPRT